MAKATRILMCPPDHFHVNYAINPWMKGNEDQVSQEKAMQQWRALRDLVARFAEVVEMEPRQGVPDMVFTANAGTVAGKRAVVSSFAHKERQPEEQYFADWFRSNGYEVGELPKGVLYEGAGDSLFDRAGGWLWAGSGFRSDVEAQEFLADFLDVEVLGLKLVDERFYHIDTCFCPLSGGYLMYYPDAYDVNSNRLIEERVPAEKRIIVQEAEAAVFSCNAINVGQDIIMHECSERLRGELEKAGFRVHTTPLTEFLKAGGSAKCLSLKLDEPEPVAR
ncbi:dimethylarginine dimethylaminohydrolase family protein [Natronospira bacteriovora]|uniref:Dimethylarginine dimethylaminohydrolase family protein n=1 Tax=Natronospira bacteriovora TaxID=3069753 RepID=A0ABU0W995_9GAMM|nr:dimethylarginine dimethylaminohydrolase family protein [Natronospira sp. AB-CW4]MDQ2070566.1 dimethylarginine dimethylaminohydrolase family protein [Natronospira sp. AB-CW4]